MRLLAIAAAFAFLITAGAASAAPMSIAPGFETGPLSMLELIQAQKKSPTITQRIKRTWRSLVDYQFCARCPAFFPLSATTCSVKTGITGPNREEARATCASRYPICSISDGAC